MVLRHVFEIDEVRRHAALFDERHTVRHVSLPKVHFERRAQVPRVLAQLLALVVVAAVTRARHRFDFGNAHTTGRDMGAVRCRTLHFSVRKDRPGGAILEPREELALFAWLFAPRKERDLAMVPKQRLSRDGDIRERAKHAHAVNRPVLAHLIVITRNDHELDALPLLKLIE